METQTMQTKRIYSFSPEQMADYIHTLFFRRDTSEGWSDARNNCVAHCEEAASYTLDFEYWSAVKKIIQTKYK